MCMWLNMFSDVLQNFLFLQFLVNNIKHYYYILGHKFPQLFSSNTTLSLVLHITFWLIQILLTFRSKINWIYFSLWWIVCLLNVSSKYWEGVEDLQSKMIFCYPTPYLLRPHIPNDILYDTPYTIIGVPCITDCVMAELEKMGTKYRVALRYSLTDHTNFLFQPF